MRDKRDVTGVWYGRYDAEHWDEKNGFIATLEEFGGAVSGSRNGDALRFVKQYDGSGGLVHAVNYSGRVNGEGTEVGGAWTLPGGWGRFVMEREKFDGIELEAEKEAEVEAELTEPMLR